MLFFVRQKVQISSKILPKIPNFRRPKMRPFQQCTTTVTAVNLFYEVLSKQFEAFGFYTSPGKTLLEIGHPEQLLFLLGITL